MIDGILDAQRYGAMFQRLHEMHHGRAGYYYFSIPIEETVRRHATRPLADVVSSEEMRGWYRHNDILGFADEQVVDAEATAQDTAERIMKESRWIDQHDQPPVDICLAYQSRSR